MPNNTIEWISRIGEEVVRYGLKAVGAILLLIVGWMIAGWASRTVRRVVAPSEHIDATLKPLLASLVHYAVLVFVVIAVLAQFGVQTASVIAVLGAAGLAIGLALQGTLANIAAGVMLLFLRPLRVGEYIDADGIAGTVDEIGLFTTHLRTWDGVFVSAPNAQLWNRTIRNYSRLPIRLVSVPIGIAYGEDINKATAILRDILEHDGRVLKEPPPEVKVSELNINAIVLTVRCWTNSSSHWDLSCDLTKTALQTLEAKGITLPSPLRVSPPPTAADA